MDPKPADAESTSIVADGPRRLAEALQVSGPRLLALQSFDRRVRRWCRPRFPFGHLRIRAVRRRWFHRIVRKGELKNSGKALFVGR